MNREDRFLLICYCPFEFIIMMFWSYNKGHNVIVSGVITKVIMSSFREISNSAEEIFLQYFLVNYEPNIYEILK